VDVAGRASGGSGWTGCSSSMEIIALVGGGLFETIATGSESRFDNGQNPRFNCRELRSDDESF
jgi:hypothetical protein